MPEREEFWNPYRFVPMPHGNPPRRAPQYHHKPRGSTGRLWCRLEAVTALLVAKQSGKTNTFWTSRRTGKPTIPGTSLKGMLRSVVELVGHGCSITSEEKAAACRHLESLCIACRIFGWVGGQQNDPLYQGHVSVGDGEMDWTPTHQARWSTGKVYLSGPN